MPFTERGVTGCPAFSGHDTDKNGIQLLELLALRGPVMPGFPAAFLDDADHLDDHAALDCLDHVVDREASDRNGGQRLHLDAGLPRHLDCRAHRKPVAFRHDVDCDVADGERMAKRNEFVGLFRRHDAGDAGGAEHVALLGIARNDEVERGGAHAHEAGGDRDAFGRGLWRYIDHTGSAAAIDMGERLGHDQSAAAAPAGSRVSNARVAASTSACRIRLSPTTTRSRGAIGARRSAMSSEVTNVLRSRLLMPTSRDFRRKARSISPSSCTSRSTSMPSLMASASTSRAAPSSSAAMMTRMQSAANARASAT